MSNSYNQEKLRVVLVVPNFRWCKWDENTLWHFIPYNLCLLAAMVEGICEIAIIDANATEISEVEFTEALARLSPHVLGITVLMDQYAPAGHYTAKIVKEYNSEIKVIMGGVYATMNSEQAMSDPNVDYIVIGEGEYVFRDLLGYFREKNPIPQKGISYRLNGKIINGGHSNFIEELDALPLPAYRLIDFEKYANSAPRKSVDSPRKFPYARIFSSRGCPFGCVFCQVELISGKMFRPRSARNVLGEIQWLKEKYGVKSLIFDDDNMLIDRRRAVEIFQGMIARDLVMPWSAIAVATFRLDDELIELMRASGCEYIDVAPESGSQRVLKEIIGKPVNLEHAKSVVAKAREEGIYVAANFVIGFPTETWDEIRQTTRFAEELNANYVKIFNAVPLLHTRLWSLCQKEKCFKKGFKQSDIWWNAGQIETKDFSAGDLTILRAYEWDRINFTSAEKRQRTAEMMGITEEELLEIRRKTLNRVSSLVQQ